MIKSNLLLATVIENDGRIGKQFTFLGSVLVVAAGAIAGTALWFAVGYAIAIFYK